MSLSVKKAFIKRIKNLPKGPSNDFLLSLIGEVLKKEEDIDYYLVVYQILSNLDRNNGRFLLKYIRKCLYKGYDINFFSHTVWLAYIGERKKLLLIFLDTKNYDFFFRYYIGLLLDITKNKSYFLVT